jgi:Autotransporter beta-domain
MFYKALKGFTPAKVALLVGTALVPVLLTSPVKADEIADRIIQNVIQNILQNVRDQIQNRRLAPTYQGGRVLQFSGDADGNVRSSADDPFAALAYAKGAYTKAPPMAAPAPLPTYLYGLNLTGSGDWSRSGGVTTTSAGVTGAVDITKIGIFSAYDAFTFIATGSGIWSDAPGLSANTGVGAGTVAYTNGGFSVDFTVDGTWTSARLAGAGLITGTDSTGISYAPNVHYKFELGNEWFIEPVVGVTYTQSFDANFGAQTGDSTEVHGGARFGTESAWNGVKLQPSLTLEAFSLVAQSGAGTIFQNGVPIAIGSSSGIPTGEVGGRASGKLNVVWTPSFSSYIEAHGSGIASTTAYGAQGGLRWSF